jgi:hypothetical protein
LKGEKAKGLRIFQLILSPCAFNEAKFEYKNTQGRKQLIKLSEFQAANAPSKTLREMKAVEQERILLKVAQEIAKLDEPGKPKRPKPKRILPAKKKKSSQSGAVGSSPQAAHSDAKPPESIFSYLRRNFRTAQETAKRNACINNLRQIDGAKIQWMLENGVKDKSAVPTAFTLAPYLSKKGLFPKCPLGGSYTIGSVDVNPTCSLPGHILKLKE